MSIQSKGNGMKRRHAFTLIEIIVAIMIVVTMASIATPMYMNYTKKANIAAAKLSIEMLDQALAGYKLDVGSYPDTAAGLRALIENTDQNTKWDGPYLKPAKLPLDPWGHEFSYTCPGEHGDFDLISYGKDGQQGGTSENADVCNWE